jgi:hypothetical protein
MQNCENDFNLMAAWFANIPLDANLQIPVNITQNGVLLRKLHSKQSACFMVFTKGPIYRGFATSDRSQNDSKMNFAMEPAARPPGKARDISRTGWALDVEHLVGHAGACPVGGAEAIGF